MFLPFSKAAIKIETNIFPISFSSLQKYSLRLIYRMVCHLKKFLFQFWNKSNFMFLTPTVQKQSLFEIWICLGCPVTTIKSEKVRFIADNSLICWWIEMPFHWCDLCSTTINVSKFHMPTVNTIRIRRSQKWCPVTDNII